MENSCSMLLKQSIIIITILLTFMHKTTPKLRFKSLTVEKLTLNDTSPPTLSIRFNGEVTVKNSNFGEFRFGEGNIDFFHGGDTVGGTKARSIEKMNVRVVAESKNDRSRSSDADFLSGKITLWSNATLHGKIHLIKRKATATMSCIMDVDTRTAAVKNLKCK